MKLFPLAEIENSLVRRALAFVVPVFYAVMFLVGVIAAPLYHLALWFWEDLKEFGRHLLITAEALLELVEDIFTFCWTGVRRDFVKVWRGLPAGTTAAAIKAPADA